ncbi:MAG: T9SS type A sorting domain-containing protein [Chlorobi bacterium]|nr:T9SS type A sorting domain-containing protein [Chlorobiota bacterium]
MKSKIKTLLAFVLALQSLVLFSQPWPKYYGEPNKYDFSKDIVESYDKGYLMCGNIQVYSNEAEQWGWIIKTDINGEVIWDKVLENQIHLTYIRAIEKTMDGGLLVCGLVYPSIYYADPFVMKLNACGEKEWCKQFSGAYDSSPSAADIKETETGEIILLVNEWGTSPEETMHLFKLSHEGDVLWKKPFCSGYVHPEGAIPLGHRVLITSESDFLIAGEVYWENPWNPGGTKVLRPLFVMADSLGNEKWVLPFGLQDTIAGESYNVIEKTKNEFIGIASLWPTQNEIKPLFIKFDNEGASLDYQIINVKEIDTSFSEGHLGYIFLKDSSYYLSGTFEIYSTEVGPVTEVIIDTNLFETEPQIVDHFIHDSLFWPYTFDTTYNQRLISNSTFKETGNWDIALSKLNLDLEYDTLDPGNYVYDSLCSTPGLPQSGFIFLDDCDIVTGMDVPSPEEYYAFLETIPIKAFPNPASEGQITFEFKNTEHHKNMELRCFDIFGKVIHKEKVYRYQGESKVSLINWQKGMYVAVVYSDGFPVGERKFVVQ